MTPVAVAELLEQFASQVTKLPGVSRTNPHAFAEAKSELAGEMTAEARRLRLLTVPRTPARQVGEISTGMRSVDRRDIPVVRRHRA